MKQYTDIKEVLTRLANHGEELMSLAQEQQENIKIMKKNVDELKSLLAF